MKKGIDVSIYQGNIDWSKTGVDFAILRCGVGDNVTFQDDKSFEANIRGCEANNIPWGVYIYSYATHSTGEASIQSEIDHVLRLIKGRNPFCVYIDMEDASTTKLGAATLQSFALQFCNAIKAAGYKAGVYANQYWFTTYLNPKAIADAGYSIWVAKYSTNKPTINCNYDIWQYAEDGGIPGINDNKVDMNYMINDITGGQKPTPAPTPAPTNKSVDVYYRVRTQKHGWLSEVKNLNDYAGWQDSPITDVAMKVNKGSIKYRVHVKGGNWLGWITSYDINNRITGYAGNGKPIDAIEIYYNTPSDIRPYKKAKYKVNNYSWQYDNEKTNGQDGYAGAFGRNVTKLQIVIE